MTLTGQLVKTLRLAGFWAMRINAGQIGNVRLAEPGAADILVVKPYGWLECKQPGERLTKAQIAFRDRAEREGVRWARVETIKAGLSVVESWWQKDTLKRPFGSGPKP